METIKVIIGKGKDLYGAYSDNVPGIWGEGATIAETKQSFLAAIHLFTEHNKPDRVPAILKSKYILDWEFETEARNNN